MSVGFWGAHFLDPYKLRSVFPLLQLGGWVQHMITSTKRLLSLSFHRREKKSCSVSKQCISAHGHPPVQTQWPNDPVNHNKSTSNFQILPACWLNVHWLHTSSHTAEALLLLSLLCIPFVEFTLAQQTTRLVSIIPAHLAWTVSLSSQFIGD